MVGEMLLLAIWLLAALVEGGRDAFLYHYRTNSVSQDKRNIHWLFVIERAIIFCLIMWAYGDGHSILDEGVFGLSLAMMFSLIHNGVYYQVRHHLDKNVYPKGFWSSSVTSQATLEFNLVTRIFLFATGIIGIMATL